HTRVLAARDVMAALTDLRAEMGLDQGPVRMRLTGSSALRHEEMQSVIDGAALTGTMALVMVTIVMLLGLRSLSLSLIALTNLAFGLILTTGFAALAIGRVNLISVSFVVLYIGLGVNYAVHFLLRYREIVQQEQRTPTGRLRAIIATGRFLRRALLLSAVTTALGFFAFVPTAFSGIAQLGLIAGVAMGITLLLSYTTLPAMLALFQPKVNDPPPLPGQGWRRALGWPLRWRVPVLVFGALVLIAALPALPRVGFDSDPLNVRDPAAESVMTIRELLQQREAGYRNIQVLVPAGDDPEPLRQRLQALPTVERAVSLASFVPADQDDKLALLEDLSWLLGPDIPTADWQPRAVMPDRLAGTARTLAEAIEEPTDPLPPVLIRLADALDGGAAETLAGRVNRALVGGLEPSLGRLTPGLAQPSNVTAADLPDWLVRQWQGAEGSRLIQVFPGIDVLQPNERDRFVDQVLSVAEDRATGGPVIQQAAGQAITNAFRQALIWAVTG
ncbi:MAG: MMPL family transporter, partial [Wenzhouxiangellaceae bacterium]